MFQQIEANKRWSAFLMALCAGLLLAIGWALDVYYGLPYHLGVVFALAVALITGLASYYAGDSFILSSSSAYEIGHANEPRLFNVVEEMAIAAGVPMPRVFIIEDPSPNAFATGRDPQHATVAITRGLLDKLNRDELQGVIAHEISHVRNYDIRFMMLMAVMVGTIALLSDVMWRSRWYGSGRRGRGGGGALLMVIALVLLILSPLAAQLIQLAASRRREYLADASAALLTRYPQGLASALQKLEADPEPLSVANRATQHLYIVNPLKNSGGSSLWDTHPPLAERIARLQKMAFQEPNAEARPPRQAPEPAAPPPTAAAAPVAPLPLPIPAATLPAAAALDTPVAVAPPPTDTNTCPRCQEQLVRGKLSGRELRGCKACGGVWIGEAEYAELLALAPGLLAAADRRYPNLVGTGWRAVGEKRCPVCGTALRPRPLSAAPRLVVDRCEQGHGLWFDDGELAASCASA